MSNFGGQFVAGQVIDVSLTVGVARSCRAVSTCGGSGRRRCVHAPAAAARMGLIVVAGIVAPITRRSRCRSWHCDDLPWAAPWLHSDPVALFLYGSRCAQMMRERRVEHLEAGCRSVHRVRWHLTVPPAGGRDCEGFATPISGLLRRRLVHVGLVDEPLGVARCREEETNPQDKSLEVLGVQNMSSVGPSALPSVEGPFRCSCVSYTIPCGSASQCKTAGVGEQCFRWCGGVREDGLQCSQ